MHRLSSSVGLFVALVIAACAKSNSPTLDEVLDEFRQLNNMSTQVSCQCFETIGGGADYTSEQECLEAAGSITADGLACMKDVLATLTQDEAEAVELIQCYNAAFQELTECKQANVGTCSVEASNDCVYAYSSAINACDAGYSDDDLETLWACRF